MNGDMSVDEYYDELIIRNHLRLIISELNHNVILMTNGDRVRCLCTDSFLDLALLDERGASALPIQINTNTLLHMGKYIALQSS